jgi:hypothetical protein
MLVGPSARPACRSSRCHERLYAWRAGGGGARAEAREGDVLVVEAAPGDGPDTWLHRIMRPADGRELARARTRWRADRA